MKNKNMIRTSSYKKGHVGYWLGKEMPLATKLKISATRKANKK